MKGRFTATRAKEPLAVELAGSPQFTVLCALAWTLVTVCPSRATRLIERGPTAGGVLCRLTASVPVLLTTALGLASSAGAEVEP